MLLCRIRFMLPFGLRIPRDLGFTVKYNGRLAFVRVLPGKGMSVYSYVVDDLSWRTNSPAAAYYKITEGSKNGDVVSRIICFNEKSDRFINGVTDYTRYTLLDILFEIEEPNPRNDTNRISKLKDEALEIVRYFIGKYLAIASDTDVFMPSADDTPGVELYIAEKYIINDCDCEGDFTKISQQFSWRSPAVSGLTKADLTEDQLKEFGDMLLIDEPLPIYYQILADAKKQSFIYQNHSMSIVLVETGFEAFLQYRLSKECEERGINKLEKGSGTNIKAIKYSDAIESGDIREELLGKYLQMLIGKNIKDTQEYQYWYERTYKPRKDIIHRGKISASQDDAKAAFVAAIDFVKFIDEKLLATRL